MADSMEGVVSITEVYSMAQARKAQPPVRAPQDKPFVPRRISKVQEGRPDYQVVRRGRKTVQFYVLEEVLERFDEWYQSVGIDSRTQALIFVMDNAARTRLQPPDDREGIA